MFIDNLKPLTNYNIIKIANELKIKDFRGVFMRDTNLANELKIKRF